MAAKKPQPRGVRNFNPGNIRHGDPWQGLAPTQTDPDFCQFESPMYGIRAIARLLITYKDKYNLRTVDGLITRWAPPNENDSFAYAEAVAAHMHVGMYDDVDVHKYEILRPLVEAIIRHENGMQPYSSEVIDEGLRRAGVVAPPKSIARDPEAAGAGSVAASAVGTAGVGVYSYIQIQEAADKITAAGEARDSAVLVIGGSFLTVAIAAFVVWRAWRGRSLRR